jgi:hypothetical protein
MRDHNRQRTSKACEEDPSFPEDMLDLTSSKSPNMPSLAKPPAPKKKKTQTKIKSEPVVNDVASPKKTGPKKTSPKKNAPGAKSLSGIKSPKRAEKPALKKEKKPQAKSKNSKADLWAELAVWAQKMSKAEREE